jgi:ribosomal protein S18 acetylase RimI-like enzyme
MSNTVEIIPLSRTGRDIGRFLQVSYTIYAQDPLWVAPLLMDLKKVFTDANPLLQHARIQLWVARRDGRDIGRIAGICDDSYNRTRSDKAVFFGFFECVDDPTVAGALFQALSNWGRQEGATSMLGPMNPTTNDECGLLVQGFDSSPVFMMPYNPAYYVGLLEEVGCTKAKDLLAFHIDLAGIPLDRLGRIADKVRHRYPEVSLRAITKKSLAADINKIKDVYNSAWEENWGFVPMTAHEMDFMAERLKPLLMEGLVWIAEAGPQTVGFLLALPDYNPALKPLNGKLLTPAIFGFLPYLLQWKKPTRTRVITLGVTKEYRNRGLESAMLIEGLKVGFAAGVKESEASWILEDNVKMSRVLEAIGGKVYKIYRLYERKF